VHYRQQDGVWPKSKSCLIGNPNQSSIHSPSRGLDGFLPAWGPNFCGYSGRSCAKMIRSAFSNPIAPSPLHSRHNTSADVRLAA